MNLLVISNNFPNHDDTYIGSIFAKEQIKYLKNHFDNIYVVCARARPGRAIIYQRRSFYLNLHDGTTVPIICHAIRHADG